ncbi:MAG: putative transporter [Deltaproteobacteria bacterium]|nr:putative transporter [Deltaproteobacteria bacterium]
MEWLVALFRPEAGGHASVAHSILILALVAAVGLFIGSLKIRGLSLGVAGVLFAGIAFGHFGLGISPEVLEFAREFGLILFVYTIGMQVGPGFFSSLRRQGLRLNLLAGSVVVLGVLVTIGLFLFGGVKLPAAVGLFSGSTTNTPSLAAAQQAMQDTVTSADLRALPGLGYAIAYPFGVLGIILVMYALRGVFRIDVAKESQIFTRAQEEGRPQLSRMNLDVQNANLDGLSLKEVPFPLDSGVVGSRIRHAGKVASVTPETRLAVGDTILAVGPKEGLEKLRIVVGAESSIDLREMPSSVTSRRMIVTHKSAIGRPVTELNDVVRQFGVTITRVSRADIDLPVSPQVRLNFGDQLLAVGEQEGLDRAAGEVGDQPKALNHPMLVPVFVGIALGVIVGSWPLFFPGAPAAVKLGLAGGPLLVAIALSRIGKLGPLVWYMPISANFMLREVGIALFLACVGLKSGDRFVATLVQGDGLKWMGLAALITVVPLILVGLFSRLVYKMNYLSLCGLLAGSMTDPPALAFVTQVSGSEGPSIAYATVYPLTMFLRVLSAQFLVIYLL